MCPGLVFSLWTSYFLLSTGDRGQEGAIGETKFILSNWRLVSFGEIPFFFHSDSVWFHLLVILADWSFQIRSICDFLELSSALTSHLL